MDQEGERDLHQNHPMDRDETPLLREHHHIPRRTVENAPRQGGSELDGIALLMQMMADNQAKAQAEIERKERLQEKRRLEDLERQEQKRLEDIERQQAEWERKERLQEQRRLEDIDRQEKRQLERDKAMREHQLLMLSEQNKAEERMVGTHRESQSTDRRRQDALISVPHLKEGENLEEFFQIAERRLEQGRVDEDSWVAVISAKLTGRLSLVWLDTAGEDLSYEETKQAFLRLCGFTPKNAGEAFFGFSLDQCKGLTAEQLYHRGQKLFRRMNAPIVPDPKLEFSTLLAWVYHLVPKRAKVAIDTRVVKSASELIGALSDYLMLEGNGTEGVAATFRQLNLADKEKFSRGNCFTCGKPGHRAINCRQDKGSVSTSKPWNRESKEPVKIICFHCQEEGHKAPQCPKRQVKEEPKGGGAKTRPLKRLRVSSTAEVELPGKVNGLEVLVLLDSGANVSVVPEHLVSPEQLTGKTIWVRPFKAKEAYACPVAKVPFTLGGMQWEEEVAVDTECGEAEGEILYSLDIRSDRGLKLIVFANEMEEEAKVNRVTTRSEATEQRKREAIVAGIVEMEKPKVKAVVSGEHADERETVVDTMAVVQPRVTSSQLKKALKDLVLEKTDEEQGVLVIPPVLEREVDLDRLVKLTEEDESLKAWREKADVLDEDFAWGEGLLFKVATNQLEEEVQLLVLPQPIRTQVMKSEAECQESPTDAQTGSFRTI